VTPKLLLHALVTTHTDGHRCAGEKMPHFNRVGFHCATDSLVVAVPFIDFPASIILTISSELPLHLTLPPSDPLRTNHPLYGLRGPPQTV